MKKKKKTLTILMITTILLLGGCGMEASRVSYNLSQEADNSYEADIID